MRPPKLSTQEITTYAQKRLGFEPNGDKEIRGPCPVHHGEGPNFSLNLDTGAACCHSQCSKGWPNLFRLEAELSKLDDTAAIAEVGRIVGREFPSAANGAGKKKRGKLVATYAYQDETKQLLFEICRFEDKKFAARRPDPDQPGKHRWKLGNVRRVPYYLPEILAADCVFVAEGEKDADTLIARGYTATTAPFGAEYWRPKFSEFLRGKEIVIVPDRDLAGAKHALKVAHSSLGIATRIRIVELPEGCKDITEFFEAGHTREEFDALVAAAPEITTESLETWATEHGIEEQARNDPGSGEYRLEADGVWYQSPNSEKDRVWLCAPLRILADTRDEVNGDWGRQLEWEDADGQTHTWSMPLGLLATDQTAVRGHLAAEGMRLGFSGVAREHLSEYLATFPVDRKLRCVARTGLYGDFFVFPDEVVPAKKDQELVLQNQHDLGRMFQRRGTLKQWQAEVAARCRGNSRLVFGVSGGFAPVFLELLNNENGGFMYIGPSSIGKSSALVTAASVAGHGVRQCRATLNGLEAVCEAHNDSLLCLDELSELNDREAPQLPYLLANVYGKSRMTKLITMRRTLSWRLLYLISGEQSIHDLVRRSGVRLTAGADVRLLSIPGNAGKNMGLFEDIHGAPSPQAFAQELRDAATQYVGHAYREFLRRLLPRREFWMQTARNYQQAFIQKNAGTASGEVQRAAGRFALIGAAGAIATDLGITGWPETEAEDAAETCFKAYVELRGGKGAGDVCTSVQAAKEFLALNGSSRFQPWDDREARILNRAGFRRLTEDGSTEFFIFRSVFETEICRGSPKSVAAELEREGLLVREDIEHWTVKRAWPVGIPGNSRLYLLVARKEEG